MLAVICGVAGLLVGAIGAWAYSMKHAQSYRDGATQAKADLAVRDSQLLAANEMLGRERAEHENSLKNMELTFENMSNRVLANTVEQFNQSQEHVQKERDSKLDLTLKPLESLLDEYKKNLVDFNKEHAGALFDVKTRAVELLASQQKTQDETRRLNQLLGRGDQRGHWGEVQLENVMEASGLRRNIDYDLQVSGVNESGRTLRPDCIVKMPNEASIAIDAKFPFDAFEAALATDDAEQRRLKHAEHAAALRLHVKTLKDKSYWELITPAPEFVVCFVPSDFAITAAFDADPQLHAFAAKERVLIVGPTNLLSLLWSVAMVLRQHDASLNAEEILKTAESMVNRIRMVVEPITKMGKSLDNAVDSYNKMVKSVETRLVPAAHRMRGMGGAQRAKPLPQLESVDKSVMQLNEDRWGVGPDNPLVEGASDILELEEFDEESDEEM
jgi:DNA recombination protein RmuC